MARGQRRTVFIALGCIATVAMLLFAFRTQRYPGHISGELVAYWRWGMLRHSTVDHDRDGRVDREVVYRWSLSRPDAHTPPKEIHERIGCTDELDLWILYSTEGTPIAFEFDADCDGVREKRVTGDDLSEEVANLRARGGSRPR